MKKVIAVAWACMLLTAQSLVAQDANQNQPTNQNPPVNQETAESPPDSQAIVDDAPVTDHVFIIFTDSKPDQLIVLDDNGTWMPNVKSVKIEMTIGEAPTCTCTMWEGYYKPSNPITKTWSLKQAQSATPQEFQGMIDSLQKNPSALATN